MPSEVLFARGEKSMVQLSQAQRERSRKNESAVLRAIAATKQNIIAQALGVDESTISRLLNDNSMERFAQILAVCGLKVIGTDMLCYDAKTIESLLTLAKERLAQIERPEQLSWDE